MSTGRECVVFKTSKGWFCAVQQDSCPVGAWDWREYAECYGPAESKDAAYELMREWHANPGGHHVIVLTEDQEKSDPYLALMEFSVSLGRRNV